MNPRTTLTLTTMAMLCLAVVFALQTFAPWRDLRWLLPLVLAGNVVAATLAWFTVELVTR